MRRPTKWVARWALACAITSLVLTTVGCTRTVYVYPDGTRASKPPTSDTFAALTLTFSKADGDSIPGAGKPISGRWAARDTGDRDQRLVAVTFEGAGSSERTISMAFTDIALSNGLRSVPAGETVTKSLNGATFTFTRDVTANGPASAGAFTLTVDPATSAAMAASFGSPLNVSDVMRVALSDLTPATVTAYRDAGVRADLDGMLRLRAHRIEPTYADAWRDAGRTWDVDELIRAKNHQLKPDAATEWTKAGYDFDLGELIRSKNHQLDPAVASAWKGVGYNWSQDELIRVKNHQLDPAWAGAARQAGYKWAIDDLIRARNHQIASTDLKAFADAGYRFSLDDLIRLKNHQVSPSFAAALHHPDMENLSADDLIALRQRGVDDHLVRRLRGTPRTTAPAP